MIFSTEKQFPATMDHNQNLLKFIVGICHEDGRLVIACLRSLRVCFMSNQVPPDLIYEDANIISSLVRLLSKSSQAAECAAHILQRSCKVCIIN